MTEVLLSDPAALAAAYTARTDSMVVVHIAGEADFGQRRLLADLLHAAVTAAGTPPKLVVDLSGLTFADTTAVGVLLECREEVAAAGGFLDLAAPSAGVATVLNIVGAPYHP